MYKTCTVTFPFRCFFQMYGKITFLRNAKMYISIKRITDHKCALHTLFEQEYMGRKDKYKAEYMVDQHTDQILLLCCQITREHSTGIYLILPGHIPYRLFLLLLPEIVLLEKRLSILNLKQTRIYPRRPQALEDSIPPHLTETPKRV